MNLKSTTQYLRTVATNFWIGNGNVIHRLPSGLSFFRFRYLHILMLTGSLAQAAQAADIQLEVNSITDQSGTLYWSIYDSENSYTTESNAVVAGQSKVITNTFSITLHGLPHGNYAVKLFHDANDNGKMDTNLVGLPQEGYGFSNNGGSFGPASYSEAKVEVKDNVLISIRLR